MLIRTKNVKYCIITILFILIIDQTHSQIYIPSDPFYLLSVEKSIISVDDSLISTAIRPIFFSKKNKSQWTLKARSEFFYNSDAPNLENMSDRWIGKGIGFFNSVNFAFRNKYLALSAEPYYFISQNSDFTEPIRMPIFTKLNDSRVHIDSPYITYGIREMQLYAHYKGIGAGYSNANMWWGAGLHTSSSMTNNTSGFGHLFIGTIEQKRYKNWGFNGRYIFSKLGKKSKYEPYFTAALLGASYYSEPTISIGIIREALTGGTHEDALDDSVSALGAALSIFKGIFIPEDIALYRKNWSHDDHAGSAYISILFNKSKLLLFFEIARTDLSSNPWSLFVYPDHAIATNIGFRKYGLLGHGKIFLAAEYFQNINSRSSHRVQAGDWYGRTQYDFNSYNGRRWAAHSGSDSDDFLLVFGILDEKFTILPSLNYERHRVAWDPTELVRSKNYSIINQLPDTKLEFRLDLRYKYKAYKFNLYYEREITYNLAHTDVTRKGSAIWLGIERDLTKKVFTTLQNRLSKK